MKRVIFLLLVLTMLTLAQSKWQPQIDEINQAMIESVMNNDPVASLDYYTEDAISLPSYSPMMVGKEEMLRMAETSQDEDVKWLSFELNTKYVWESGDFVIEIGNYKYSMEISAMMDPYTDVGKYLTVYEIQDDGSLKIKADTWNTDLNPWAAMTPPEPPPSPDGEMLPPPPPEDEN